MIHYKTQAKQIAKCILNVIAGAIARTNFNFLID